jgi:hemolysin activation/secretion protein
MGTLGRIGALCCVLWITLFNTSEAGESREGKDNRTMMAQARNPQAERGSGTSTPDSSPVKPSQAGAPSGGPPVFDRDPAERRFQITSYLVEGNAILEQAMIDSLLAPYKGPDRQLSDMETARNELEKAYHAAGYPTVVVMLPEQTIDAGVVKLQVLEGRLVNITITGNEHYDRFNIRGKLPSLQPGALIYEPTFIKEMGAVNGNPDLKVAPVLKPGTEPGTVDLELKVKDRLPVHGKLEGDNRGPITTPQNRLIAEIQHTNLFGGDEILTVNTVQTPTDWGAVQNYGASFVYPVKWPDHLLAVYGSHSKSNSVLAGSAISVGGGGNIALAGNATVAGFRYILPLFPGGENTHQLSAGVDYKHLEPTNATFPGGGTAVVLSQVQYTPASVAYSGFYPDRLGLTKLSLSAKGYVAGTIPGGAKEDFARNPNDPDHPGQRRGSTGTFAVLQGGLDRVQPLPGGFALALHADGQWGSQPLIPAEGYFAGGFDTVRGYRQFEAIGDNAVRGRAELTTPELIAIPIDRIWQRRRSADYTIRVKLAAFYDAAQLWVQNAQPGQTSQFRLEGVGGGIRVKFPKDVGQLIIDQGFALRDTAITKHGDTFVHFSVGLAF